MKMYLSKKDYATRYKICKISAYITTVISAVAFLFALITTNLAGLMGGVVFALFVLMFWGLCANTKKECETQHGEALTPEELAFDPQKWKKSITKILIVVAIIALFVLLFRACGSSGNYPLGTCQNCGDEDDWYGGYCSDCFNDIIKYNDKHNSKD